MTESPSGIEYALTAVAAGAPSVGIKASNGVVIATENKHNDEHSVHKVEMITKTIGMTYSGMCPDYRFLVRGAREIAQTYQEQIPMYKLVEGLASVMQEYTKTSGVRLFGVSLLVAGWNEGDQTPFLFQCNPSGAYFPQKPMILGKTRVNVNAFNNPRFKTDLDILERSYNEGVELEEAVYMAVETLKESFEGQMNEDNIEIGISNENGFRRLEPAEIKDYLASIA